MLKEKLLGGGGSQAINFDYTHLIIVGHYSTLGNNAYGYSASGQSFTIGSITQENIYPGDQITLDALYYNTKATESRVLLTINSSEWYIGRQGFKTITPSMLDEDGDTSEVAIFSESDENKQIPIWIASVLPPWD